MLGNINPVDIPEIKRTDGVILRPARRQKKIDLKAFGQAVRDPLSYLRQEFLIDSAGVKRTANAVADLIGPWLADNIINNNFSSGYGLIPELQPVLTPDEIAAAQHMLVVSGSFPTGSNASTILNLVFALVDGTDRLGALLATSGDLIVSLPTSNGVFTVDFQGALEPLLINSKSICLASGNGDPVQFALELSFKTTPEVIPAIKFGSKIHTL